MRSLCWILLTYVALQAYAAAEPVLLRTVYPLDEARGYCLDIAGFGRNARIDEPLQVHTCKYGAELSDQLFEPISAGTQIALPEYDRCLAVERLSPGARLVARTCADRDEQRWAFAWGQLKPATHPGLCVTIADGPGNPAGTPAFIAPVYRSTQVSLENCSEDKRSRQTLRTGPRDEHALSHVDTLRENIPVDIAERLAEIGNVFGRDQVVEMIPRVLAIPRTYDAEEIEVARDVSYGPDERHSLDIRTATLRRSDSPVPVVVTFHGGGLIGGSKEATADTADYFASLGYVGVNAGYRLAPDHPWPAGPLDVGLAVTWLSENIADFGGDPEKIFVLGISSGSLHSAGYVFRSDLLPAGTVRAAGAILMSGPYTFDFASAGPSQHAYYGDDPTQFAHKVVVGNVTSTDIPVLFATAQWDPPRYTNAFTELLHEIVIEHGVMPRYHQSIGHNHESQRGMIGTAETNVALEIIDFINQVSAP